MDACKDEVDTDDEKDAEEDDEATVGDLMEAPKADINRVLARIDKALAKRSELKKEPIEKKDTGRSSKNLAYDNANAMQARSTDAGRTMNSPYGPPDMENIDGAPVSRAGFTVNNISFEPGLRYGRYNRKTHRVDAVPKGAATMIPRVEPKTVRMPDGTIENRLVPVKDKNGNVILEPMPYNGAFLLNPTEGYGNPYKFMPVYYEVETEPVYKMKNGKQVQVGTRFKRDEFGNYVPRLDANKKIIPLKKNRNRDGELEQNYMKNPGMMRGESSFNSTGYMKDAMWIRNKFGNNAFGTTDSTTWSEIKDTLRRLQEEEIANRDKMHWLRNITRLLVDADRKSNSNEFGSHPIIDREGMGWYREDKPTYGDSAFEAGVSSKPFADQAINDETSYLLPGTTPNKKFTNEKGEEQIWYPKYGKARYPFNEKSALRGRHFNDIMDALGAADNNALDEQKYNAYMEYANAKVNRKPGDELDLPPEYLGLTAQERKELINTMSSLKTLESRLESEDLLPVERAKLKKDRALLEKKRNALFRTMASRTYYDEAADTFRVGPGKLSDRQLDDYMNALNLEQTRLTERDKKEALKNNIIGARMLGTYVPRNDKTWATNKVTELVRNFPNIWYDKLSGSGSNTVDIDSMIRLFQILPRHVVEDFVKTNTLHLNPRGIDPGMMAEIKEKLKTEYPEEKEELEAGRPSRLTVSDSMKSELINKDLASRKTYANKWLSASKDNREIARKALAWLGTAEGRAFCKRNGYINPADTVPTDVPFESWSKNLKKGMLVDAATIVLNEASMKRRMAEKKRNIRRSQSMKDRYDNAYYYAYHSVENTIGGLLKEPEDSDERLKEALKLGKNLLTDISRAGTQKTDAKMSDKYGDVFEKLKDDPEALSDFKEDIGIMESFNPFVQDSRTGQLSNEARNQLGRGPVENKREREGRKKLEEGKRIAQQVPLAEAIENSGTDIYEGMFDRLRNRTRRFFEDMRNYDIGNDELFDDKHMKQYRNLHRDLYELGFGKMADMVDYTMNLRKLYGDSADLYQEKMNDEIGRRFSNGAPELPRYPEEDDDDLGELGGRGSGINLSDVHDVTRSREIAAESGAWDDGTYNPSLIPNRTTGGIGGNPSGTRSPLESESWKNQEDPLKIAGGMNVKNTVKDNRSQQRADAEAVREENPKSIPEIEDYNPELNPLTQSVGAWNDSRINDGKYPATDPNKNRNLFKDAEIVKQIEKENREKMGDGETGNSGKNDLKPIGKSGTMESMMNMSMRDMMESIAKNAGKEGHPYGLPVGGSVFTFGCVPVSMGQDGRTKAVPDEIPEAKRNDEGLTRKNAGIGPRVRN